MEEDSEAIEDLETSTHSLIDPTNRVLSTNHTPFQHTIEDEEPIVEVGNDKIDWNRLISVFKSVRVCALSVTFAFTVTIGLFPALIVLINSTNKCKTNNRFYNDLFTPFLFLMFNLFDFIGRYTAGTTTLILSPTNVWKASLARIIFFPLFMLCNVDQSQLPIIFTNDAFPILIMALFATSNGYISSACMIMGPQLVAPKDSSLAGTMMVFFLTVGLACGGSISFLVVLIARGFI